MTLRKILEVILIFVRIVGADTLTDSYQKVDFALRTGRKLEITFSW
ncbi:hypothetical protein [Neolewinella antarctica]|uniref:Uncharacterized protein n=1 Tax=Neolewinella antarctica TaxID=442734 RepID=A0ABX0XD68_9BACT|nr:hypothetical protein [Neolewinella antarctica]NJC27235.1 hypothetical protein [Neolewinella antarctica]